MKVMAFLKLFYKPFYLVRRKGRITFILLNLKKKKRRDTNSTSNGRKVIPASIRNSVRASTGLILSQELSFSFIFCLVGSPKKDLARIFQMAF